MTPLAKNTGLVAGAALVSLALLNVHGSDADTDGATVWALEEAIYARRAAGDARFYSDISSEQYLGWPAPAESPVSYESIRGFTSQGAFQPGEVIDVVSDGITVDGDTAISFYSTIARSGRAVSQSMSATRISMSTCDGTAIGGCWVRCRAECCLRSCAEHL